VQRNETKLADTPAAPLFAALGDPVRLAMVERLSGGGPLSTLQLKQGAGASRQAVTKHLHVLENAGLVTSGRVGRDRQWRMQADQLTAARGYLDQISKQWDLRLERLRNLVEEEDNGNPK
jgi:DNA-binding transcriptional ArsR family regulator